MYANAPPWFRPTPTRLPTFSKPTRIAQLGRQLASTHLNHFLLSPIGSAETSALGADGMLMDEEAGRRVLWDRNVRQCQQVASGDCALAKVQFHQPAWFGMRRAFPLTRPTIPKHTHNQDGVGAGNTRGEKA